MSLIERQRARCFSKASVLVRPESDVQVAFRRARVMTSPALMIASGAALTGGGRQVGALLIADLKTSPNNCEILAFNEAPGAQLIEEGDAREPLAH